MTVKLATLALLSAACLAPAFASPLPTDEAERRCWLSTTREQTVMVPVTTLETPARF